MEAKCSQCKANLSFGDELANTMVTCAKCRFTFRAPGPGMKRATFIGFTLFFWFLILCFAGLGIVAVFLYLLTLPIVIFARRERLKNIGLNTNLAYLTLVPVANIILAFYLMIEKENAKRVLLH